MMFSKRHYQAIAALYRLTGERNRDGYLSVTTHDLADMLGRDNARFDRERFLSACIRPDNKAGEP